MILTHLGEPGKIDLSNIIVPVKSRHLIPSFADIYESKGVERLGMCGYRVNDNAHAGPVWAFID